MNKFKDVQSVMFEKNKVITKVTAKILVPRKLTIKPKISIVMPVYNAGDYLAESLDSALSQTLKEIEVICIDDGSTDNSVEILKEYAKNDDRVIVMQQQNSGSGKARNNGINYAQGQFVAFLDSDDTYPQKNTLEIMHKNAAQQKARICGGGCLMHLNGKIVSFKPSDEEYYAFKKDGFVNYMDYQFDCGYWRFIYELNFLKENQLYFPDYLRGQDPPFFIKAMALAEKFYALSIPTYFYRMGHKSINWTERRLTDYVYSLIDSLKISLQFNLDKLSQAILDRRIDVAFFEEITKPFVACKHVQDALSYLRFLRNSFVEKILGNCLDTHGKKKVFLITSGAVVEVVGGATSVFWNFSQFLSENGFHVTCLCYAEPTNIPEHAKSVNFVNLKHFYKNYDFEKAINAYFDYNTPDLVIFFFPEICLQAKLSEKFNVIPKIQMFHSRPDFYFSRWRDEDKECFKRQYVNTASQVLMPSFVSLMPDYAQKGTFLINGNPVQQKTQKTFTEAEKKKIVFLSRIDQCKGLEFLIESYKSVAREYPDWELHIWGQCMSKEYEKKLNELLKKADVEKQIKFMGVTKKVIDTLCEYDFCIFPSYFEGFSLGLTEALSVGLPCIGLKGSSGVNELIQNDYNGFLCDENYEEFAKKIKLLIQNKKLRLKMGKNAIKSIKQYDPDVINSKWLTFINDTLNKKSIVNEEFSVSEKSYQLFSLQHIFNSHMLNEWAIVHSDKKLHKYAKTPELIVSLTSYPKRINTVHKTIESLYDQRVKADKIILWLSPEQFPNKEEDLPETLLNLKEKGLIIDWYQDIRSYKKLIPTLKKYPHSIIITADDDIIYSYYWIERLVRSFVEHPDDINCHRSHRITLISPKCVAPYSMWPKCIPQTNPAFINFCTTGGGVVYPPNCFYKDVLKEDLFLSLCPTADDIWFWAMCVLNSKKIRVIKDNISSLKLIDGTQDTALYQLNVEGNQNDVQLTKVLKAYPKLRQVLYKATSNQLSKNLFKAYALFPLYLYKLSKAKKKLLCLTCKNIWQQLIKNNVNVFDLNKGMLSGLILKYNPQSEYVKKNLKYITNVVYDKCKYRKKHRILGIKFYTRNKHKELMHLMQYTLTRVNGVENQIQTLKTSVLNNSNQISAIQKSNSIFCTQTDKNLKELSQLNAVVSQIKNDCVNLMTTKGVILSVKEDISNVQQTALSTKEDIANVQQTALSTKEDIATVQQTALLTKEDIATVQQTALSTKKDIATVQQTALSTKEDIAAVQQTALSTKEDIATVQQTVLLTKEDVVNAQQTAVNMSKTVDTVKDSALNTQEIVGNLNYQSQRNFQELNYADLLHDTICESPWLKNKTLSLFGWAANYSFIYLLYRVLDKVMPQNILEMGLGQTTKLTSQYVAYKNSKAHLNVCEHNQDWINIYQTELPQSENMVINHFDLSFFEYEGKQNDKYKDLTQKFESEKFDLIIVDGPVGGGNNLPRSNILDLVQNDNLANDFIIIFDDSERVGEKNTIASVRDLLKQKGIDFVEFDRNGIKNQHVITSSSRSFVQFL